MIGKSLGHYEVLAAVGSGGMGEVYRARDNKLGRDVALKLLPATLRSDDKALARFEREARALAALNHPNIVTIYSFESVDDVLFMTMELVAGESLESYIREDGMTVDEFREIAVPLADAVAAAHASGITHRDLKPGNILIAEDGSVKVLDFGLALVPDANTLTGVNTTAGTVAYMSPEQISGGAVDGRSDIFSLGIVFFELLSGVHPFRGDFPAALMYSILNEDAPGLPFLPDAVDDLVARCLDKNPDKRHADAEALGRALRELERDTAPVEASPPASTSVSAEVTAAVEKAQWEEVHQMLHEIARERELSAEELELFGESAIWLSEVDEGVRSWEKAFAKHSKAGRNVPAAGMAVELAGAYVEKLAPMIAGGWLRRAERLLQNEPVSLVHGALYRRQSVNALAESDFECAIELNEKCAGIAERFDDPDLTAVALHDRGKILVVRGDVDDGLALIDEAMTTALSGEVTQSTLGVLYCRTLIVCRTLADYNRAREWTEAASRWSETYKASAFPGICLVHSAETMRHQGKWLEAEKSVRQACDEFAKSRLNSHAGEAFYELGELALRKGDYSGAEDAFRKALEYGADPVPGQPLLRLAQGKGDAALQSIDRALDEGSGAGTRLHRAKLLAAAIYISIANGKLERADEAVDELTGISKDFGCECFTAHALMGRGAVELERGDYGAATLSLREAWSVFKNANFPYDAARAQTLMARAYLKAGNKEDARQHLEAACKTFRDLGAKPDLETASRLVKKSK